MNSHFGTKNGDPEINKPTCLIVDEVDGAVGSGGSLDGTGKGIGMIVDYLKKCISYQENLMKKKNESDDELDQAPENAESIKAITTKNFKKKKDDGIHELRRPIIFICNDAYAKALLPLKEIALQIKIESSCYERLL